MGFFIDIILIALAAMTIYKGAKNGFFRSVMNLLSIFLALLCVLTFSEPVAEWYGEKVVGDKMTEVVENDLTENISSGDTSDEVWNGYLSDRAPALTDKFRDYNYEYTPDDSHAAEEESEKSVVTALSEKVASPFKKALCKVLASVTVFLTAFAALKLITFIVDKIFKFPGLKSLNKLLGIVFGIISAAVLVWFLSSLVIRLAGPISALIKGSPDTSFIDNSVILKFFRDSEIIK